MNALLRATSLSETRRGSSMIAHALIDDIKAGVLPVNSPLPTERDLCDRFDASRPTVREALTQMQMQGYLTSQSGHRPRASRPSLDSILRGAGDLILDLLGDAEAGAHLEQTRQFIEMGAARAAASRPDTVQLAKLQAALAANEAAIATTEFAATDIAFHRVLVTAVGNPVILTLHDIFVSRLIAQRTPTKDPEGHDRLVFGEHKGIYEAVLDGDVATATEIMEQHLARSFRERLKAAGRSDASGST